MAAFAGAARRALALRYALRGGDDPSLGGAARNRTGVQGFAVLCVTTPPRRQATVYASLFPACLRCFPTNRRHVFQTVAEPVAQAVHLGAGARLFIGSIGVLQRHPGGLVLKRALDGPQVSAIVRRSGGAGGRSPCAQWDFLGAAFRRALAGFALALWPVHDLLQSL